MKTTLLSLTTLFAFSAGVAFAQTEKVYVKKGETYVSENLTISEEVVSKTAEANGTYHEKDKNYSGVYMHGVFMEITGGTANLSHVDFLNNKLSLTLKTSGDYDSRITGGFAKITHSVNSQTKEIIPAKMTVSGNFKNNTSIASVGACPVYGGIFYVTGNADLDISNSIFENNISSSTYNVQGAVIAMDGGTQNITIKNSEFKDNQAVVVGSSGYYGAMGGVMSSVSSGKTINVTDTKFIGNSAVSADKFGAGGGVAYLKNANIVFNNVLFADNYTKTIGDWDGGGAMYTYGESNITFNITENTTYSGNYVVNNGVQCDELGGFARFDEKTTANFNIAKDAELVIGDGRAKYDSIAGDSQAVINKLGEGSLIVNSSMEFFKGELNVNEGVMSVTSEILGASDIVVKSGASLLLGDGTNIVLYSCSITLEEGATLELGENSTITVNLGEDFTGTTTLISVADGAILTQGGESVSLAGLQEKMTVTYMGETLDDSQWAFDAETGKLISSVAVPEPAEWAMILGALALGFVVYRRRK